LKTLRGSLEERPSTPKKANVDRTMPEKKVVKNGRDSRNTEFKENLNLNQLNTVNIPKPDAQILEIFNFRRN
jgi:hypothetical protein